MKVCRNVEKHDHSNGRDNEDKEYFGYINIA